MRFILQSGGRPDKAPSRRCEPSGGIASFREARLAALRALRCRRGIYALEFSIIGSTLFLMSFGAIDMAWLGLNAAAVENATLQASRAGSLGCLQPDGTRAGQAGRSAILAAAQKGGAGLLRADLMTLKSTSYSSLTNARSNTGGTKDGIGGSGETVRYTLTYEQPYLLIGGFLPKRSYTHTGNFTIKNEPFDPAAANAQPCT